MQAFTADQYGTPEVLKLCEVPDPVPADNEILIRIRATTVNRTDDGFLRAKPFIARFFTDCSGRKTTSSGVSLPVRLRQQEIK